MDIAIVQSHLALAEKHVAQGEGHLDSQRAVIARLERNGSDSTEARRLLKLFEQTQELHIKGRNRLKQALAELQR
jgi:hypothetical protein